MIVEVIIGERNVPKFAYHMYRHALSWLLIIIIYLSILFSDLKYNLALNKTKLMQR